MQETKLHTVKDILTKSGVVITESNIRTIYNLEIRYKKYGFKVSKEAIAEYIAKHYNKDKNNLKDLFNDLHYMKLSPIKKSVKISRNAPCPCGSGKKFKKCCLNKN